MIKKYLNHLVLMTVLASTCAQTSAQQDGFSWGNTMSERDKAFVAGVAAAGVGYCVLYRDHQKRQGHGRHNESSSSQDDTASAVQLVPQQKEPTTAHVCAVIAKMKTEYGAINDTTAGYTKGVQTEGVFVVQSEINYHTNSPFLRSRVGFLMQQLNSRSILLARLNVEQYLKAVDNAWLYVSQQWMEQKFPRYGWYEGKNFRYEVSGKMSDLLKKDIGAGDDTMVTLLLDNRFCAMRECTSLRINDGNETVCITCRNKQQRQSSMAKKVVIIPSFLLQ